jgi:S-methylmethionine-dependent homocysteine/selenocysteine methylase
MNNQNSRLPQLDGGLFLTDGGIETTLIYQDGFALPLFAAFPLLRTDKGLDALRRYYRRHASIALERGVGFVLESATWRASADWGARLGYSKSELDAANRAAIDLLHGLRRALATERTPMVVSGCVGPRGDGYRPDAVMTPAAAQAYHANQIGVFAAAGADLATAITITNSGEAIGIVRAARAEGLPVVISFTVETDARLPSGETLPEAIAAVDGETRGAAEYFMINCAHPSHFAGALVSGSGSGWVGRIRGIRANASTCSHAELDEATMLDSGDPVDLGLWYRSLRGQFHHLSVLGGCCGTDHRHIEHICDACLAEELERAS